MNRYPSGPYVRGARCIVCNDFLPLGTYDYVCPKHGREGLLDIEYDYEASKALFTPAILARSPHVGMWRYRALLPLPLDAAVPPLFVGLTPLYDTPRLACELGVARVFVKDEGRQATGSLKDRASALAVALAQVQGAVCIAAASSGNAAAALAGMAASMNQTCVLFVPETAPEAKIAQLLAFGAMVFTVRGSYTDAFELCMNACARRGWYNRNTGFNPFMAEGKKTVAYEIVEQLGWKVPDAVFVAVGDGCILAGLHKGFRDLLQLGFIDKIPRLYGVQAAGSDYLMQAWEQNENVLNKPAIVAHTVADSIRVDLPRDRVKAMQAVRTTEGAFVRVTDAEILAAIPELAANCGVFAEPAGAAAWAGAKKAREHEFVNAHESVCLLITGNGLKDSSAAIHACQAMQQLPCSVAADEADLERVLAVL